MQRVPTRQRQAMPNSRQQNGRQQNNEASPALLLARRIREEQGVEQLKSFLTAMEPFIAPNELRTISGGFGINYDTLARQTKSQTLPGSGMGGNGFSNNYGGQGMNAMNSMNGMNGMNAMHGGMPGAMGGMGGMPGGFNGRGGNQLQMLQMLMNMPGMMKGGGANMSQLFKMMGGR